MAYIQSLYRRRAPNAMVRGAISAVRAVEDMEHVEPTISRKLWHMANYSLPGDEGYQRTFGGLETLHIISQGCKDRVDWSFYGLAVLSFVGVLRVGGTVSVRRRGFGEDTMCFRGVKNSQRLFTRDLRTYAAAWSEWLKKHRSRSVRKDPSSSAPRDRLGWRSGSRGCSREPNTRSTGGIGGAGAALPCSSGWGYPSMLASGGAGGGPAVLQQTALPPPPRLHLSECLFFSSVYFFSMLFMHGRLGDLPLAN